MKLLSESVFREFGKVLLNLLQVIIVATLITNPLSGKDVITNDLLWVYLAAALFCFMFGWLFIRVADRMKEHKEKQEKKEKESNSAIMTTEVKKGIFHITNANIVHQ